MATSPYPFPFPASATYPAPTPGFSPVPAYGAPPAYPCAATYTYASSSYLAPPAPGFPVPAYGPSTFVPPPPWPPPAYPYPPPAPAYASPTSFYPAQPYGPSTVPYATTSSCLTSEATPIPTNVEPNWPSPAPAPTPIHGDLHHHHSLPTHDHLTVKATPQPNAASTAPSRELCLPQPLASATQPDPTHLNEFELQLKIAHRSLLNISRQLDEYQAKSECSYAYLKREISKLVDRVPSSKSSITTAPTPSVAFTPSSASAAMAESSTSVLSKTAPAYVAPQVLDEMPQCYSLHNLKRQTVFRADGSEHSYYMLPEESPVEKATPSILPPAGKNVGVMVSRFVQAQAASLVPILCPKANITAGSESLLIHNLQLPMTVQDYHNGLMEMHVAREQQDDKKASVIVQQPREPQWDALVIHVTRKEWDPGEHPVWSPTRKKAIVGVLQTSILTQETANHLTEFNSLKYRLQSAEIKYLCTLSYSFIQRHCSVKCIRWLNTVLQSMGDQVEGLKPLSLTTPWDPGVLVLHFEITRNSTRTIRHAEWLKFSSPTSCECSGEAPKRFSKPILRLERSTVGVFSLTNEQSICGLEKKNDSENLLFATQDIEQLLNCASKALKCTSFDEESKDANKILWDKSVCRTATEHSVLFFLWDPGDTKIHVLFTVAAGATKLQCPDVYKLAIVQKLAVKIGAKRVPIFQSHIMRSDAFSLGWTKVHAAAVHVLAVQHSEVTLLAKHYLSLLSQYTQEQDQLLKENEQTSTYCSKASEHALICQHSLMSTTVTPQVQSQEIERKPVYDAYHEEDNACLTSVDAVLIYNSEKQKVTSASFVWDPGTMLLWYKCKWCLLYTEERINWLTELRCYGVALWLIHFQPP